MKPQLTFLLTLVALTVSACGLFGFSTSPDTPDLNPGDTITLTGEVVDTIDDCAFDGICALVVEADGERWEVIYAPGMMMCEGEYDGQAGVGSTVEVYAEVTENPGELTICTTTGYYIR